MYAVILDEKLNKQQVFFGGVYKECWTDDYRMTICYDGRKSVQAVLIGDNWTAISGDEAIVSALKGDGCPEMKLYFQAAAQISKSIALCRSCGIELRRLHEEFSFRANPLCASELMRALMDDHGFRLEEAYDIAACACDDIRAVGVDVEQMYSIQPRTAHVISILRKYSGERLSVYHRSDLPEYRSPFGAVPCGQEMSLAFKLQGGKLRKASLCVWGDNYEMEYPMEAQGDYYRAFFNAPEKAQALWYCFKIEDDTGIRFLCAQRNGYTGRICAKREEGFRLTVYLKDFETPGWFRESIMYQIYPDRFAFSDDGTAEKGIEYHEKLGQTPELHKSLDEPVRYLPRAFEKDYSPDDFYGGTLKGIQEKLPYLKDLGISCIYLNPIVEARSNHRYDCSDYLKVDPVLGCNGDFEHLAKKAGEMGIRIMLDGVFSHTGADSIYFNRYGNYDSLGACQGEESSYFPWYDFKHFPDDYRSWWGVMDLPEVDETNENWQEYVISGADSVVKTWLRRGAAGWRLDVADELPDEVLSLIRKHARLEKADAPVLGEVWEDAVIKESYGSRRNYALGYSLDSVMNYPFRSAMLDFVHRRTDAYGLRDFLVGQQMNYPKPMYYSLMNLMGTHDTDRVVNAMATGVVLRDLSREQQIQLEFRPEDISRGRELEKLCAAVQFAIPGVPSIYYGDEQGMQGVGDPFNRLPFKEGDGELHELYKRLCMIRNSNPALSVGKARFMAASKDVLLILRSIDDSCDVFGNESKNGTWLIAVNRGAEDQAFCIKTEYGIFDAAAPANSFAYIEIKKEDCK